MLLLPPGSFEYPSWIGAFDDALDYKHELFKLVAEEFSVTHVASNAPVPLLKNDDSGENILRSPVNLKPLYGDFGPLDVPKHPTQQDFDNAFWVSAKQNGIIQTWAPLHTMFSRGNIKEKARLLELPTVKEAVENGRESRKGSTAVDLYAGIGYFAFSYAKAGVDRVLCWELNPWSVEGLRRGAELNKWSVEVRKLGEDMASNELQSKIVVFQGDNTSAWLFIVQHREELPPVRHVNCGLLPTSRRSWKTAVRTIDPILGGWIHIHENIPRAKIQDKSKEVTNQIQCILVDRISDYEGKVSEAVLEHVEKVKTYAPGIVHCVLDTRLSSLTHCDDD